MAVRNGMLIGKVIQKHVEWKAVLVSAPQMVLDERIHMYFNERTNIWAADKEENANDGDIVLIKQMRNPQSDKVKHTVRDIVFPLGRITDPVTGRRVRGTQYISEGARNFGSIEIDSETSETYK